MAGSQDLYLLGIGYRHVKGGEDEFAGAGKKIKDSAHEAAEGTKAFEKGLDSVKESIHDVVAEAAALVAAYVSIHAAIDGALEGVKLFAEFDKGTAQLRALTQATAGDFDLLSQSARDLGASTIFGAAQAAAGMTVLSKAGESTREVLASMKDVEHLAIIGHEDLAAAADDAALTLHRFNLAADQTGHVVDVLATLTTHSRASVGDLVDVMKQAGPAAGAMGLKFEDLAAVLGVMSQQGGNARASGSALVNVLAVLSNPTKQIQNDLKILGLSISDLSPRTHSLVQILETLGRANLDAGSAFALFGHQGGAAILQVIQNLPHLHELRETLGEVEDAGGRLAETMENNLASSGERLEKVLDAVKLSIGAGLAPALSEVSKGLQDSLRDWQGGAEAFGRSMGTVLTATVNGFVLLVQHGRELAAVLVGIGVAMAAMPLVALAGAAWVFIDSIGAMTLALYGEVTAVNFLKVALEQLWFNLAANPVTITLVALAALAAILYEVISRSREASAAEEAYQADLASSRPVIEGVTYAHGKLADKLREELELRQKLASGVDDLKARYGGLQTVQERLKTAAATGDSTGYAKAAEDAQKLGVALSGLSHESTLQSVTLEMAALLKEMEADTSKAVSNNERIATSQRQLKDSVLQDLEDEFAARLQKQAQLAEINAKMARAHADLNALVNSTGATINDPVFAQWIKNTRDEIALLTQEAAKAQGGLSAIASQLDSIRLGALEAAQDLARAGKYDQAAKVYGQLGIPEDVVAAGLAREKELNDAAAKRIEQEQKDKAARDALLASQREQARLYADEIKAARELTRTLDVQIAGNRQLAAAYDVSTDAGNRVKKAIEDEAKATQASAKFTGDRRQAVYDLTLAELRSADAAKISEAAAAVRTATDEKLAESAAKVRDVVNGNTLASQRAATAAEVQGFASKNLLGLDDKRVVSLRNLLGQRNLQLQADANEAASQQRLVDFNIARRTAEAAVQDAITGTTVASQNLAVQLEIEANIKAAGAQDDDKRRNALALEVIGRHAVLDSLTTQGKGAERLRESYKALDTAEAAFTDSQHFRTATLQWGADIAGILQKYGLLSDATKKLAIDRAALVAVNETGNTKTLAQLTAELTQRQKIADEQARGFAAIEIEQLKTGQFYSQLAGVFDQLSVSLGGTSTQLGQIAAAISGLVTALDKVRLSGKAWSAEWASAVAGVVGQVGTLFKALDVGGSNNTGGTSALGGKLPGNYAGAGTIVGGIVGAIVGYFVGNVAAGAQIGAALGGVLGAMITKAGDSASASLRMGGSVVIGEVSNQLSGAVQDALVNIFKGLSAEMAKLGLTLQGLPLIDIKVRDNVIRVVVGTLVRTFSSMQDAVSFGIAEALRQSATLGGHLPPEVLAALKKSTATDLASLQSDIAFAQSIANYGVPAVVQAINKSVSDFYVAMQRAISLGIDTTKVVAQFKDQVQAQKDATLGVNRNLSPQDQLKADVKAFNDRMILLKAQEQADQADLLVKRAGLAADIAILQGQIAVERGHSALGKAKLEVDATVYQLQLQQLADMEGALAAIETALATTQGVIDSIVLISDEELAAALARIRNAGRGGAGGADATATMNAELEKLARSGLPDAVGAIIDLGLQLADLTKRTHDAHASEVLLGQARRALIEQAKKALLDPVRDFLLPGQGGTYGMSEFQKQAAAVDKTFADTEAANRQMIQTTGQRAIAFWQLNEAHIRALSALIAAEIQGWNLPIAGARQHAAELGQRLQDLSDAFKKGALDASEFYAIVHELQAQAGTELLGLAESLLTAVGATDEAAKVKRQLDIADFELKRIQLHILYNEYLAMGMLSAEVQRTLQEVFKTIDAVDPTKLFGPAATAVAAVADSVSSVAADDSRRQAILDQIKAWNALGDPQVTTALRDLNATFVSMRADAQRLGVSLADLQSAYGKAVQDFWDKTLAQYEQPTTVLDQLGAIQKTFAELIAAAAQYGGDQARIERDRLAAVKAFWDQALQPIKDLQAQLAGGQYGGVSPGAALAAGQKRFDDLAAKAVGGDTAAIAALPAAVTDLLNLQKAFSGTGPAYQALVATIQSVLAQIVGLSGTASPAAAAAPPPAAQALATVLPFPGNPAPALRPLPATGQGGAAPGTLGPIPVPDSRMDKLLGAVEGDVQARKEDRASVAALRTQVDRLVKRGQEQDDKIDSLISAVTRLAGLVESQERKAAQGRRS